MFKIEMLEAKEGDALWIEYGDEAAPHRMLIDCGYKSTYRTVMKRFAAMPGLTLELFVLTHIDGDHIAGSVPFIADARITPQNVKKVWFNSRKHLTDDLGLEQALYFTHHLIDKGFSWNDGTGEQAIVIGDDGSLPEFEIGGGLKLTLLSPTREKLRELAEKWDDELEELLLKRDADDEEEIVAQGSAALAPDDTLGDGVDALSLAAAEFEGDTEEPNGSSIAFLAEFTDPFDGNKAKSVLFLGDAHSPVVEQSLQTLLRDRDLDVLVVDALKVSHHGSKKNTSARLLELLDCKHYLFSTNGSRHDHPDAECVARVVAPKRPDIHLYFNYESRFNKIWKPQEVQDDWSYTAHFPENGKKGITVLI